MCENLLAYLDSTFESRKLGLHLTHALLLVMPSNSNINTLHYTKRSIGENEKKKTADTSKIMKDEKN
jgi:hypothetical protein